MTKYLKYHMLISSTAYVFMSCIPSYASDDFDCLIEPSARVELTSESIGVLDRINVGRGDHVRKGQVVANLRSKIETAATMAARAKAKDDSALKVQKAKAEYEVRRLRRHAGVIAARAITEQEADEVKTARLVASLQTDMEEAALERAGHELEKAEAALNSREVKSTIDGIILSIDKEPGEYINGESIITIVSLDPLNVEVFTPIRVAVGLKPGQKVTVKSTNHKEAVGTISVIDRVADAASGTVKILVKLPNSELSIFAGQNCRARFNDGAKPSAPEGQGAE